MKWDYFVDLHEKLNKVIQKYDLASLEQEMRVAKGQEKSRLRKQIEDSIKKLRMCLQKNISTNSVTKVVQTLTTHLLDNLTLWWFTGMPRKEDARIELYIPIVSKITIDKPGKIGDEINFRPDFKNLPSPHWLGLQVDFKLLTPWYSKDERIFHVLDNPVRKDRVFGVPFMSASSWKGLLRWACRMQAGLSNHLEEHGGKLEGWNDPPWILHLFGNEKGEEEFFHKGALVFYPTWFNKIGFEVINPHDRTRRAGTQPIYYEVVPPDAQGTLSLLYAPWPGMKPKVDEEEILPNLLKAIEMLLETYGISAKRTVGWGTTKILEWRAFQINKRTQVATLDDWENENQNGQKMNFWEFFWNHKIGPWLKEENDQ